MTEHRNDIRQACPKRSEVAIYDGYSPKPSGWITIRFFIEKNFQEPLDGLTSL